MEIILYRNNAEDNRVDKSSFLVELTTLSGTMRENSSVTTPSLLIALPYQEEELETENAEEILTSSDEEISISEGDSLPIFNYLYIPSFHRYYFVSDIEITTSANSEKRLYRVSCRTDVLMSYKDSFLPLTGFIERNEFLYDDKIIDTIYPFTDELEQTITTLSDEVFNVKDTSPNIALTTFLQADTPALLDFVDDLSEAGYTFSQILDKLAGVNFVSPPSGVFGLEGFNSAIAYPSFLSLTYILNYSEYEEIIYNLNEDNKAYLKSAVAFPLNLYESIETDRVPIKFYCGTQSINGRYRFSVSSVMSSYVYLGSFSFPSYRYDEDTPYTSYNLYVPFLGKLELNYSSYAGKQIRFYITFSLTDGTALLHCYDTTTGQIVNNVGFNIGVKIAIDRTNAEELERNRLSMTLNGAIGTISNLATLIGGVATENPFMITKGAVGLGGIVSTLINQGVNQIPKASLSNSSPSMQMTSQMIPYIEKRTKKKLSIDELSYNHLNGKPLQQFRKLNTLSGFTKIGEFHLENISALDGEKEELKGILSRGVIL